MLPLLKDKTIYSTFRSNGCLALQNAKSVNKFEALNLKGANNAEHINKNKKSALDLDIVIESDLCRFAVLPALSHYPEPDVLNFLIQQRLQQKYLDFVANQFLIIHDQIKYNCPCVVVAFSREKYQELMQYRSKSLLPSIIAVWNYYQRSIVGKHFLIVENQLAFIIHHEGGIIKEIDTYPVYLIGSINFDYYLDLNNLKFSELEESESNKQLDLLSKQVIHLLQENDLDKSQVLNLMRALS
ncbi:hypothetical protein MWMV7_MWMV7_02241 [Acinetobacter calcoaceticus]|nr:hypothetical protein MWMV7_MWMV7_02241 [Acinetobacter calcoaceticus]